MLGSVLAVRHFFKENLCLLARCLVGNLKQQQSRVSAHMQSQHKINRKVPPSQVLLHAYGLNTAGYKLSPLLVLYISK